MNRSKNSRKLKMKSSSYVANANQKSCSVDGCKSDPGKYREYYRRHKVCEHHSKDPVVIVRGEEQRFCQKCSRFHGLGEFDEEKRSCRKRLDGHNRRRRKSRPKPFSGSTILQFSDPQVYASPAMVHHSYEHLSLVHRLRSANSLARINHGEHERINRVTPVASAHRQLADVHASSGRRGSQKIHPNGINRSMNSCRAHSLLSPFNSMRSNAIHSIAQASSSDTHMIEPLSSTLIPDGSQVNPAGSGKTILHAWTDGLLDNPGLDYK